MSSDLLKEFGSLQVNPWNAIASQDSANGISADEDEFGDFEAPENKGDTTHPQSSSEPSDVLSYPVNPDWNGARHLPSDKEHLQPYLHPSTPVVQNAASYDDDWGDFSQESVIFDADEEVKRQKKEAERTLVDQLRRGEPTNILLPTTTGNKAPTSTSRLPTTNQVNANSRQGSQEPTKPRFQSSKYPDKRQPEVIKPTIIDAPTPDDEPWVDFEAAEVVKDEAQISNAQPSHVFKAKPSNLGPPPSNIPPPSILLPIIATIFRSLPTDLKKLASHHPSNQPSSTLSSQLHAFQSTILASARILAGRKLRWKRDHLLSQSMKIGPAPSSSYISSGKTGGGVGGGMKLIGLDKSETGREDQEAAEAIQAWRQQLGTLRSTITALNAQLPEHERVGKIPEVADHMAIRQGRASEGAVKAPKCCFLCGVKRDERVGKVDVDVEDSFGEWWVEHWGHVDCVAFWENYKDSLRRR